jgi:hypothetical protein
VQLAHAGDDRLAGLVVGADLEGRVLPARRWMAMPSFSWSALDLGSMATLMTGAGKFIDSRMIGASGPHIVSPVVVFLRPMTATI